MNLEERLKELESRKARVLKELHEDKNNPYWYEDYGCIIDDLDKQIIEIKQLIANS